MKRNLRFFDIGFAGILLLAGLILAFSPKEARAERPSTGNANPLQWIGLLGQMGFAQGGGVFLPTSVLNAMGNGNVSPIMQYVLVNSMFNQCAKDVLKYTPGERDPFKVAKSKYTYGICRMERCIQQGMLILALPLLSDDEDAGGASDQATAAGNGAFAQALAEGFGGASSCGGSGPAIDPMLIQMLTQR